MGAAYACSLGYSGQVIDYELKASISTGVRPWYRREEEEVKKIIIENQEKLKDPYFNVLLDDDKYQALKDIKLYVQVGEFDPLLDDSVSIARKWKSPAKLDVFPGLIHGYLAFKHFSPESRKAAKITVKRIGQGLGIIDDDNEEKNTSNGTSN